MKLNAYLSFNGQCEAAFKFYERVFGGKIAMMLTHGNSPMADKTPAEHRNMIMHARLLIGDAVLMGSDAPQGRHETPKGIMVNIGVETAEEAERIFGELAENGNVHMALQETFWALRFGMLADQYGTPWMINCEKSG